MGQVEMTVAAESRAAVTGILATLAEEEAGLGPSVETVPLLDHDAMRSLAGAQLVREPADHTLRPTGLLNQVYERLADPSRFEWRTGAHYSAVAPQGVRRVLVDHARRRDRKQQGGGARRVTLGGQVAPSDDELDLDDLIDLDQAWQKLATLDERNARAVELRSIGDLGKGKVASVLNVSERTVRSDWALPLSWLGREHSQEEQA